MASNSKLLSLNGNQKILFHVQTVLYEYRYCNQGGFSILICGGENENEEALNDFYELEGLNFEPMNIPSMLE